MTKGLSKQQRDLLRLASEKIDDYHQLTTREIMIKLFGWIPARTPDYSGGQSFDVQMIGRKEYRKRMVSVSLSLGRLRQRGLMKRYCNIGHCCQRRCFMALHKKNCLNPIQPLYDRD